MSGKKPLGMPTPASDVARTAITNRQPRILDVATYLWWILGSIKAINSLFTNSRGDGYITGFPFKRKVFS